MTLVPWAVAGVRRATSWKRMLGKGCDEFHQRKEPARLSESRGSLPSTRSQRPLERMSPESNGPEACGPALSFNPLFMVCSEVWTCNGALPPRCLVQPAKARVRLPLRCTTLPLPLSPQPSPLPGLLLARAQTQRPAPAESTSPRARHLGPHGNFSKPPLSPGVPGRTGACCQLPGLSAATGLPGSSLCSERWLFSFSAPLAFPSPGS